MFARLKQKYHEKMADLAKIEIEIAAEDEAERREQQAKRPSFRRLLARYVSLSVVLILLSLALYYMQTSR